MSGDGFEGGRTLALAAGRLARTQWEELVEASVGREWLGKRVCMARVVAVCEFPEMAAHPRRVSRGQIRRDGARRQPSQPPLSVVEMAHPSLCYVTCRLLGGLGAYARWSRHARAPSGSAWPARTSPLFASSADACSLQFRFVFEAVRNAGMLAEVPHLRFTLKFQGPCSSLSCRHSTTRQGNATEVLGQLKNPSGA